MFAQSLDVSSIPQIPRQRKMKAKPEPMILAFLIAVAVFLTTVIGGAYIWRRKKYEEIREDWEEEYGPHKFSYKDFHKATKGFKDTELIGERGFGKVYRGILHSSNLQIAVKKISHDSRNQIFIDRYLSSVCRNQIQLLVNF
jgi:hypothetical protein